MELTLRAKNKRVKEKVVLDHYWYDPDTKQRLHGKGGKMIFVYDRNTKKSMPKIIDHEQWVYKNTYPDIIEWIKNNNHYVSSVLHKVSGLYVMIDVDAKNLSVIEEDLYKHHIQCDYDEIELKSELDEKGGNEKWQNSQSKWRIHQHH